jgi:polar amino acid transport system ATP-binding protein
MSQPEATTSDVLVEGVWKSFGERTVLADVSLTVAEHDVVCLIGASGSGKSTLLRCIDLLETVDHGRILLGGQDITDPTLDADRFRRRLGMVFQSFNLFPHLSVLNNVTLAPRRVLRRGRAEVAGEAVALLERFGLGGEVAKYPDQLSGGQQQRVAIVRALAMQPEVMLLDEVTSALDPELVGEVLEVIRELRNEGMTMLIATHEMGFAREIADRVCFLDAGRVVEEGPPEQVLADPVEERTRRFLQRIIEARRV